MKNPIKLIVITLFLSHTAALALIAGPVTIKGTVKGFNQKTVVIENEENKYEIPRDFVAEKNLKANNKIEVLLSQEQADKVKTKKLKSKK